MEVKDAGTLGVHYLRQYWRQRLELVQRRERQEPSMTDHNLYRILMDGLGLGIVEPDLFIFRNRPSYEQFEQWIVETVGGNLRPEVVAQLNRTVADYLAGPRHDYPIEAEIADPVLSSEDLAFWEENGYVVLRNAVPTEDARAAELAVWEFLDMDPQRPETWYGGQHTFWASLFYHPALVHNRKSKRIHKAFAQIWGTENLLATVDRASLNRPMQDNDVDISGPSALHWDASIHQPMSFGVLGILYLNDVAANQGAFQCVPGFHHRIGEWLESLAPGEDPRAAALELDAIPIAAGAGDLIIWRQELPHGSSRNRGHYPRIAQYIFMYPPDFPTNPVWK